VAGALPKVNPPPLSHHVAKPTTNASSTSKATTHTVIWRSSCSLIVLLGWICTSRSFV
jgi:hypothetical protein